MSNDFPVWNQSFADELKGAVVLVGLTHNERDGSRLEQFFGKVIAIDEHDGVTLQLQGSRAGKDYHLPPHLDAFFPAPPGTYRLRGTGEEVVDPNFTTTWEINPPEA